LQSTDVMVSFPLNFLLGKAHLLQLQTFPLKKDNTDTEMTPLSVHFAVSFDVTMKQCEMKQCEKMLLC